VAVANESTETCDVDDVDRVFAEIKPIAEDPELNVTVFAVRLLTVDVVPDPADATAASTYDFMLVFAADTAEVTNVVLA